MVKNGKNFFTECLDSKAPNLRQSKFSASYIESVVAIFQSKNVTFLKVTSAIKHRNTANEIII